MTWQYRVMRREISKGRYDYGIYEVSSSGWWTKESCGPGGEDYDELKRDYEFMAEAFNLPVLNHETKKPIRGKKP
jgi:hypothetical protein